MFNCDWCGKFDERQVINLKQVYGKTYKIGWEAGQYIGSRCPWHLQIVCKHGRISPNGKNSLWVSADRPGASRKLRWPSGNIPVYLRKEVEREVVGTEWDQQMLQDQYIPRVLRYLYNMRPMSMHK